MSTTPIQSAQEVNAFLNSLNVFQYAAVEEKNFEANIADTGYERITTFYSDLSIAERYGIASIKETYKNVMEQWIDDIKYITEFAMCLNYKSWEWSSRENDDICQLYVDLFYEAQDKIYEHYEGNDEALRYYYEVTD